MRWMEYLVRFNFDINYVKGINNKVADTLSRYYKTEHRKTARFESLFKSCGLAMLYHDSYSI